MPGDQDANWSHLEYWKSTYIETPLDILSRSNGRYDGPAILALKRSDESPKQTSDDNFLVAKILAENIIINDNYSQIATVVFGSVNSMCEYIYMACINSILSTKNTKADIRTTVNRFLDIYSYLCNPIMNDIFNCNERNKSRLDKYYHRILNSKMNICENKRSKFIKPLYTSNYSTSMDSTVVNSVKRILTTLKLTTPMIIAGHISSIDEIIKYYKTNKQHSKNISSGNDRPIYLKMVIDMLLCIENNNYSNLYDIYEADLIELLWARAHHPKNDCNNMKQALYDAVFSCWSRGIGKNIITCINGRIAILVGMLAVNDFDKSTWNIQRTEHIKNDIYHDITQVLNYPNVDHRAVIKKVLDNKLANPDVPDYLVKLIRFECSEVFI
jgi:hypothetical protein